jgi:hypothetical protein
MKCYIPLNGQVLETCMQYAKQIEVAEIGETLYRKVPAFTASGKNVIGDTYLPVTHRQEPSVVYRDEVEIENLKLRQEVADLVTERNEERKLAKEYYEKLEEARKEMELLRGIIKDSEEDDFEALGLQREEIEDCHKELEMQEALHREIMKNVHENYQEQIDGLQGDLKKAERHTVVWREHIRSINDPKPEVEILNGAIPNTEFIRIWYKNVLCDIPAPTLPEKDEATKEWEKSGMAQSLMLASWVKGSDVEKIKNLWIADYNAAKENK